MKKLMNGGSYNIPVPTYYIESDDELANIPANEPGGTIAEVNEPGNFHIMMKMENGEWNEL